MSVQVGEPAPNFTLKTQDDEDWTLSKQRGRRVVLMWYPLDWSPTCTTEHCKVDRGINLSDDNTVLVGISRDSTWSHRAFRETNMIAHDLLADPMLEVTKLYGLVHPQAPFISQRATVIVDSEGNIAWSQVQDNTVEERNWNAIIEALKSID